MHEIKKIRLRLLPAENGGEAARRRIYDTLEKAGLRPGDSGEVTLLWPEDAPLAGKEVLTALLNSPDGWDVVIPVCRGEQGWPVLLRGGVEDPEAPDCRKGFARVDDYLCTRRALTEQDKALMEVYGRTAYRGVPGVEDCRALLREQGPCPISCGTVKKRRRWRRSWPKAFAPGATSWMWIWCGPGRFCMMCCA